MMKTTTLIMAITFYSFSGISQIAQSPVNKQQQEIKEKQEEETPNNLTDSIINDLLQMKLITDKNHVSFALSNEKFKVNDKEQAKEVFEKFKSKYHIVKGYSIAYAKSGNSKSTSIVK